ncbi:D-alanyl-D-alanine carboxypeptidase family protein [Sphingomonas sp.]|uniref:D-alanyl-D-alanine carboxypeptidase family protein n=1 Tax=Sphingomonas sp. TaxID=28214 RepID=UPI001B2DC768|nr:D-alanyl-D-alanine carboxypeptidase family protein [Sphingomonas sp.]MBO9711907.1 D-alanyl-D-alanine carboxypeptidase [Sphingomonas sp.]
MKKLPAATLIAALLATPATAAAPTFDGTAPIAYMEDMNTGAVLFQRDADRRMPPASMAKMMTVYVAFTLIRQGKIKLDTMYTVSPDTWRKWHGTEAGSLMFLEVNSSVSVENLLKGIVTLSGNDACVVLAEGIAGTEQAFTSLMNQQAAKLGLSNSHFGTSNGWPDNGVTYVTARDLAKLAAATIRDYPDLYKKFYSLPSFTWGKQIGSGDAITQNNRDPLLGRVAGADGLKTGHTDEAKYGFTGSAEQNGRRLVMVVAGLETYNLRADESVKFMNWGFRAWTLEPLVKKGRRVGEADVQNGSVSRVGLVAPTDLGITVPSGTTPSKQAKIVYNGPIDPGANGIKAGDHIADLIVQTPDAGVQTLPLVAETDVAPAGFFRRIWLGFWSLFGM